VSFPQHPTWSPEPADHSQWQPTPSPAPGPQQGWTPPAGYHQPPPAAPGHNEAPGSPGVGQAPSGLPMGGFRPPPPTNPYHQAPADGSYPPAGEQIPPVAGPGPAWPDSPAAYPDPWTPPEPRASRPPTAVVMTVAGLAVAAGSVLNWMSVDAPTVVSRSWPGIETYPGRLTAVTGLLIALLGFLRFTGRSARPDNVNLFVAFLSLMVTVIGVWQIRDVQAADRQLQTWLADNAEVIPAGIVAHAAVGSGLWLLTAAGALGLLAALLGLRRAGAPAHRG
jgi:hypothetical protein